MSKLIVYQLLPRYFTNKQPHPVKNGTLLQNGCGKFDEINEKALRSIQSLGVTHVWLTGILEHATKTDYSNIGIQKDHPAVVKGNAGSPYAIKDYYDVDPDLAVNPENRLEEFGQLLERCHTTGLNVIIDFVPNHTAREYKSDKAGPDIRDFGVDDHKNHDFNPSNNYYYLPGQEVVIEGDKASGVETPYRKSPARATGNDCFSARPGINDWYDTTKLNYGVNFFAGKQCLFDPAPSTWFKMLDVLQYWAKLGVDGFRCDMAEMVPVEFWSWVIPRVKKQFPSVLFIAEVYQPNLYRSYLQKGGFDYLYDKVGMYEVLRGVIENRRPASDLSACWQSLNDILPHMLYFLENHDEQRIASEYFAGNPLKGVPGMIVAACLQSNPVMIYYGQELGEAGMKQEGFSGNDGKNSIFDYWSLRTLMAWNNQGRWDGGGLSADQKALRETYARMLNLAAREKAISEGVFFDLTYANLDNPGFNSARQFAFFRKKSDDLMLIVVNFDSEPAKTALCIPLHAFGCLDIDDNKVWTATDLLAESKAFKLTLHAGQPVKIMLPGYSGVVLKLQQ